MRTLLLITMLAILGTATSASAQEKAVFTPEFLPEVAKTVQAWDMAPSHFMAEGRTNIYLENVKKPMHAWMLAFAPGAYSLIATMVNKTYDQDNKESDLKDSKFYFAAIPAALGSLYAERYWEALVITAGQAVGSYFIWSYFNLPRGDRNDSINNFYMGVGIYAFFWVADMIYAPVMSWQYNKKLAKLYLSESSSEKTAQFTATSEVPSSGNAMIGPGLQLPTPFMVGFPIQF
ncbi:hypothetical protein KKF84_22575 [Myxococcota bacterium]|nr:hypothetical protein [Myxococcota bacterium]MBU1538115.1 hypothetical protein [Myxococcota bacterium]